MSQQILTHIFNTDHQEQRWIQVAISPWGALWGPILLLAVFGAGCGAGCSRAKNETVENNKISGTIPPAVIQEASPADTGDVGPDLVAVGRDVEFGRFSDALAKLTGYVELSDRTRYLAARARWGLGDFDGVAKVLAGDIAFTHSELLYQSMLLRADALNKLKRFGDAIEVLNQLGAEGHLSKGEARDVARRLGDLLLQAGRGDEALAQYEKARQGTGETRRNELDIQIGKTLLALGQTDEAVKVLAPLALAARKKRIMNEAYQLLQSHDLLPRWSPREQLARVAQLAANKSWDEALEAIAILESGADKTLQKELNWQKADILFSRRNHYEEARKALGRVIADGEPYGDQAAFLSARALARLDRDEEAISAFTAYAKKSKNAARKDDARFQAARLEYYLGKHGPALKHLTELVGTGRKKAKNRLSGETVRDAFFLAGMSAFLLKKYDEAVDFWNAASVGSSSAEAVERNRYWAAVALFEKDHSKGMPALENVCQRDATSWYALFAGIRLRDAGVASEKCRLILPETVTVETPDSEASQDTDTDSRDNAVTQTNRSELPPELPTVELSQISSKAALYASMGLFRPAAEALNEMEKSKKSTASPRDFLLHYIALDAPQYSIREASIGLSWEATDGALGWMAQVAYPRPYFSLVQEQEARHALPPYLMYAIARKESLFDPFALSYVGAMGMMQMMPATYETNRKRAGLPPLAESALPSPAESVIAGGFELASLLERFKGNIPLAIMAYNGGAHGVERWLARSGEYSMDVFVEKAGFAQTRNYVRRVYQNLVRYCQLYGAPLPPLPTSAKAPE